jgi:hypothetical protein
MRLHRAGLTLRTVIVTVAILVIATWGFAALSRKATSQSRQAMAMYEADYSLVCLRRIPEDIRRAFVCGRWAAEGREAPFGFVCDCRFMGMVNEEQAYRNMLMEKSLPGIPGTRDANFGGWARESTWWAVEAIRDARRAAWHASMSKKYELAASSPTNPLPHQPPEPFPDF